MKPNERLAALKILNILLQDKKHLSSLLQTDLSLSPLTKEICFGVCRNYHRLEILANNLLSKKPKDMSVWLTILIGLYQLIYLNIPEYAAVQETVQLVHITNKIWAKGLVNAILRKYCREKESIINSLTKNEVYNYSHPEWFIKKIKKTYPKDWQNILHANNLHPPMTLRVNNLQEPTNIYLKKLLDAKIDGDLNPLIPTAIILKNPTAVTNLPNFQDGFVSVQDLAAQLAASLLDLKPGLNVLDACSAPGGKTCHILETEPELNKCVAIDIESSRLKQVSQNLKRLNLSATVLQGNALEPKSWWDKTLFDRILLDAPCSATGVIRRHPDIKILRTPKEIDLIVEVQQKLLQSLWEVLAPGGKMVYATCSIMPEENENQIAAFLTKNHDCICQNTPNPWGNKGKFGWQILPGENNMDGFFYSVLVKKV